jgi:semaphorin 5
MSKFSNKISFDSNGIVGSAVCSFTMDAIQEAFSGPYKGQASPSSTWESYHSAHAHSNCQTGSSLHTSSLLEAEKFQLMDRAVPAAQKAPLIRMELERFTHVAVDVATTKLHSAVHVIFVANVEGVIRKFTVLPRTQEACLVEVIDPFRHGSIDRQIRSMHFLRQTVNRSLRSANFIFLKRNFFVCRTLCTSAPPTSWSGFRRNVAVASTPKRSA